MTTNKVERVLRQALTTFSSPPYTSKMFHDNLVKLRRAADELDARSVGLDFRLLRWDAHELNINLDETPFRHPVRTPVTYIEVFENNDVSVGVFVLRDGAKIPLHDHPYMYGVLKVIHGKVRIQSYTPQQKDYSRLEGSIISATKLPPLVVEATDEPCVLCPIEGNIHQVDTVDGPAAFIDILAPPYRFNLPDAEKRRCSYFKEVNKSKDTKLMIDTKDEPKDYWSDTAPYKGPEFNIHF